MTENQLDRNATTGHVDFPKDDTTYGITLPDGTSVDGITPSQLIKVEEMIERDLAHLAHVVPTGRMSSAPNNSNRPTQANGIASIADLVSTAAAAVETGKGRLADERKAYEQGKEVEKLMKIFAVFNGDMPREMEAMDNAALKKRVLDSNQNFMASERRRKLDEGLKQAKADYDEAKAPYDNTKKYQNAIAQYGMMLLEGRGVPLGDADEETPDDAETDE